MDLQVTCPICLNILYRPVTLPCKHEFCNDCIKNALDQTAYCCPLCRYRLSNWLRRVKDTEMVIDKDRERILRLQFPTYFRDKDLGLSPQLSKVEEHALRGMTNGQTKLISENGAIYADYLKESERLLHLRMVENKKNEEASLALCRQMLAEDTLVVFDSDVSSSVMLEAHRHNAASKVKEQTRKPKNQNLKKDDVTAVETSQQSLLKYVSKQPSKSLEYSNEPCASSLHKFGSIDSSQSKTRLNSKQADVEITKKELASKQSMPTRYFIRNRKYQTLQCSVGETGLTEPVKEMPTKRVRIGTTTVAHENSRLRSRDLTKRESLLEYAVDKRSLRSDLDGDDEIPHLIANDEEFARELQRMYLKLPPQNSPILARIRPRCTTTSKH